jgi:hypothetical protein
LKDQKKALGTETDVSQKQLELFQSLRRLLQVKLECLRVVQRERAAEEKKAIEESKRPIEMIIV